MNSRGRQKSIVLLRGQTWPPQPASCLPKCPTRIRSGCPQLLLQLRNGFPFPGCHS